MMRFPVLQGILQGALSQGRAALTRQGRPAENGAKRSQALPNPASSLELSHSSDAENSLKPGGKRKLGKVQAEHQATAGTGNWENLLKMFKS